MGKPFPLEVAAIETLRKSHPSVKKLKLAKLITRRGFDLKTDNDIAVKTGSRSVLSVYSVIRRYDARIAALTSNAIAAANATVPTNAALA